MGHSQRPLPSLLRVLAWGKQAHNNREKTPWDVLGRGKETCSHKDGLLGDSLGERSFCNKDLHSAPKRPGPWWKTQPVPRRPAARSPPSERTAITGTCVRNPSQSLRPASPKGTSPPHGCKGPLHPFPQGSHMTEGFFSTSCCLDPQLGSTGRGSPSRRFSSLPGCPSVTGKGGSSSEQP